MQAPKTNIATPSRETCVEISSAAGNSKGSGFLISDQHVATCFHVVAKLQVNQNSVNWSIHTDLKVKLADGESFDAACISLPTQSEVHPLQFDFAVLRLNKKVGSKYSFLKISQNPNPTVGDEAVFSGYPLATPGMVTHKGMISGYSDSREIIFVQGSINKGNSGGALLSSDGQAIGIVSMREGGISQGLQELSSYIDRVSGQGSVTLMGVDPLQSIRAIVQTLDTYISTGIGYARSIKFLSDYIGKHPTVLS